MPAVVQVVNNILAYAAAEKYCSSTLAKAAVFPTLKRLMRFHTASPAPLALVPTIHAPAIPHPAISLRDMATAITVPNVPVSDMGAAVSQLTSVVSDISAASTSAQTQLGFTSKTRDTHALHSDTRPDNYANKVVVFSHKRATLRIVDAAEDVGAVYTGRM